MRDISKSESDKDRDDKWNRWRYDHELRWVSLVLVLVAVGLFAFRFYTNKPVCLKPDEVWANVALIAWEDFLLGAVVVAFIWLVRSLWE